MTEEVWINNHKLDVNPTDIQIITNRYSDSFNLTREDSPYALYLHMDTQLCRWY